MCKRLYIQTSLYVQTSLCTNVFMCKRLYVQTSLCVNVFMYKRLYVQTSLCANAMFKVVMFNLVQLPPILFRFCQCMIRSILTKLLNTRSPFCEQ